MKRNREGYLVSDTHRECAGCGTIFEKTSRMSLCKVCNCERVKSLSPEWKMHNRSKQRAKAMGREFTIALEDIHIPSHCPILGIPLEVNRRPYGGGYGPANNSPSLDRIDNSKGYVPGNVHVVSQLANKMKGDASVEQLQAFAKWVLSTFPVAE